MQTKEIIKRNNLIYNDLLKGKTRIYLAKEYNLSTVRIGQIFNRLKAQRSKITTPII